MMIFLELFFGLLILGFPFSIEANAPKECLVLTLTDAIARALNYNRQFLSALEGISQSQNSVELADSEFTIQIAPNSRAGYVGGGHAGTGFSYGGGIDLSKKFTTGTQITVSPLLLKNPDHYHTELRALISQPLLRGLGRDYQLSNILASQFALRTAYRSLHAAQIQLIMRTIQALYEVVKAEKTMELNQESYQRICLFCQAAKLKEKIGMSDALDVYRAEIEFRHAEDALTSAQERLQEAQDILRDLLALPLDSNIKVEVPLIYTPGSINLEEAVQSALENRIEMDQSEDQWRENSRLARVAKKNLCPELNLVFNYANCGRDEIFTRACTRHRESTWGIGFTTTTDFNPLAEKMVYEQSLLAIGAAERGVDQTKATVILDVKKSLRQLQRANQRIHLQENQMKAAEGGLLLAKIKFDRGMSDNFNVIQAEKSLRGAQLTYWSALIEHIVGEFQLLASTGLLIDKPQIPL